MALRKVLRYFIMNIVTVDLYLLLLVPNGALPLCPYPSVASVEGQADHCGE